MNENMVWTDSQDYGADEILSHPFTLTPTVQRAACALPFKRALFSRLSRYGFAFPCAFAWICGQVSELKNILGCPLRIRDIHSSLVDAASKNGIDNRTMRATFDTDIASVDEPHLQARKLIVALERRLALIEQIHLTVVILENSGVSAFPRIP